jgi:hypothetical protein
MAEKEGFEPSMPLRACRISSAVHSTTLPLLRALMRVEKGYIGRLKPWQPSP